eukprot:TRINITY_DN6997_c0_g1_i1.p1 TRINITY_DN6997_c0_g1~~TRINITY_DN6997_c0_g1_i1.p1  ORF type:complete len:570 (-),score=212.55 TRINITY_DN6997_c0_g1_i1:52-1683(-)
MCNLNHNNSKKKSNNEIFDPNYNDNNNGRNSLSLSSSNSLSISQENEFLQQNNQYHKNNTNNNHNLNDPNNNINNNKIKNNNGMMDDFNRREESELYSPFSPFLLNTSSSSPENDLHPLFNSYSNNNLSLQKSNENNNEHATSSISLPSNSFKHLNNINNNNNTGNNFMYNNPNPNTGNTIYNNNPNNIIFNPNNNPNMYNNNNVNKNNNPNMYSNNINISNNNNNNNVNHMNHMKRNSMSGNNNSPYKSKEEKEEKEGKEWKEWREQIKENLKQKDVPFIDSVKLELKYTIGEGFFSTVRLATWNSINVAVKTILNDKFKSKSSREIFTKEVGILCKLRHPNIVQFLGVCLKEENYSIISEYMSGGTLYNLIKSSHLKKDEKIFYEISCSVCKGMIYLHDMEPPIIHRDLTSKNILLDDKLNAKVSDFGVSKEFNENYITRPVGALPYVAPEVYLTNSYSIQSDVYSFAIILWEMITESNPKGYMKAKEMAERVAKEDYRPPFPQIEEPPLSPYHIPELFGIIKRAWSKDFKDRPTFEVLFS